MLPSSKEMTPGEIEKIVRIAVQFGVRDVKVTGGEPLLREDLESIFSRISSIPGVEDISMTSNASSLSSRAEVLRKAGLQRVNVNLLSLDPELYNHYTGGDLEETKRGIEAALEVGMYPVKANMLVLKGLNSDEIPSMMEYCGKAGVILQLLELEKVNMSDDYYQTYHYDLTGIESRLEKEALQIEVREKMQGRKVYHLPTVKVEVVHPMENTEFCAKCTRLRLTS